MDVDQISLLLTSRFENSTVRVREDGGHYHITLVSEEFSGMRKVNRQQLVYQVLSEYITGGIIHAVVFNTHTPDEWSDIN